MPKATYIWLLDNSIPFNRFLVTQLNERLALFISLVEYDRMLEPDARVARCLAALFNPYLNPGIGRNLQISQEEVGNLSGTSRQRANQALQVLEKAGLLKVDYGSITINDLDGLRQFPGETGPAAPRSRPAARHEKSAVTAALFVGTTACDRWLRSGSCRRGCRGIFPRAGRLRLRQ
jgi:hypothetical protein